MSTHIEENSVESHLIQEISNILRSSVTANYQTGESLEVQTLKICRMLH